MLTRRTLLKVSASSALTLGAGSALAFKPALGSAHGPLRTVTVDPVGEIHANATVWLDSGAHRVCVWSATAGAAPSVAPAVTQVLSGVIEVEVEGQTVVRASTRAWAAGHRVPLPGDAAGVWIKTARRAPLTVS